MNVTLNEYFNKIKCLPLKEKYTKEELFKKDFLIESQGNIEIYYSTHNEYVNPNAKIFIVGITPGFQQMSDSIAMARKCIEKNIDIEHIKYLCKKAGRFSGVLRKNIILMLDEIKLNEAFNLQSCSEIFEDKDYLLHTISLIPYPVFVNGKNYSGYSPKILKSEFLLKYVYDNFINQVKNLDKVLVIPLGKAVEEVIERLVSERIIKESNVLKGFPHPSGANGHRFTQLRHNKEEMIQIINNFIKNKQYKN